MKSVALSTFLFFSLLCSSVLANPCQFKLMGTQVRIDLPNEFAPFTTSDPERMRMFMDESIPANVAVMNLGEAITAGDVQSPDTLQGIKARMSRGRFVEHTLVTLADNRKALRVVLEVEGKNAVMRQVRYLVAGDPGWSVIFTTTSTEYQQMRPKFEAWVKSFQVL